LSLDGVFFDLDGTLADTAPDFEVVLNGLMRESGQPELSAAAVRRQVSHGARALVTLGFDLEPGEPGFDDELERLLERYREHLDVATCLFPGMDQVLDQLDAAAIPWGVVTNKPERFTRPVLDGLGLLERVAAISCPEHVTERKPDPQALFLACRQAGIAQPSACIYAGDHVRDIQAGRRAGMTTVACAFGYIDPDEDPARWAADHLIHEARELIPILETLKESST
jgi:2-phosphoglycolate phosphatase